MVNIPYKDRCDHCGQSLEGAGKDALEAQNDRLKELERAAITVYARNSHMHKYEEFEDLRDLIMAKGEK